MTFSFLLVVKSPTRKSVRPGHSFSSLVLGISGVPAPVGGGGGGGESLFVPSASGSLGVTVVQPSLLY